MTREEILRDYDVENQVIRSPGKFEGEPVFAPYFWEEYLNGGYDEWDGDITWFSVVDEDKAIFPELAHVIRVGLWEDDNGFVHTEIEENNPATA